MCVVDYKATSSLQIIITSALYAAAFEGGIKGRWMDMGKNLKKKICDQVHHHPHQFLSISSFTVYAAFKSPEVSIFPSFAAG
jgi:hypothetical protein